MFAVNACNKQFSQIPAGMCAAIFVVTKRQALNSMLPMFNYYNLFKLSQCFLLIYFSAKAI